MDTAQPVMIGWAGLGRRELHCLTVVSWPMSGKEVIKWNIYRKQTKRSAYDRNESYLCGENLDRSLNFCHPQNQ